MAHSRHSLRLAALALGLLISAGAALAEETHQFNIPAQPLGNALQSLAEQSGLKIVYHAEIAQDKKAAPVVGSYTSDEALSALLKQSGLTFERLNAQTVAIMSLASAKSGSADVRVESTDVKLAQGEASSAGVPQVDSGEKLEEVVVTAQKRRERLLDVPGSISALSGERLEQLHVNSLNDLASYVPGLTISNNGAPGSNLIVIRGINTGGADFAGPLVATYIDDMPVTASTAASRQGSNQIEIMPYDLDRVEVLKGPQGSLYGANTLGGLIKYSLRKPNLHQFEARAGGLTQHVEGSRGADWGARAALNLPIITDRLALRLAGYDQDSAGYIDNVTTGHKDDNHTTQKGGRATLLWAPREGFSLQGTALAQNVFANNLTNVILNGFTVHDPLFGEDKTTSFVPFTFNNQTRSYSLDLNWDLGAAKLTSVAGWSQYKAFGANDYTILSLGFAQALAPTANVAVSVYDVSLHTSKTVSETRLASREDQTLQWMLGLYYTKEDAGEDDTWPGYTAALVEVPAANVYRSHSGFSYKEQAGFGNATYKFNDHWDVTGGIRYGGYEQSGCSLAVGAFGTGVPSCQDPPRANVWNWSANSRYHIDKNTMLYARVATGYRPGTPNNTFSVGFGAPALANPDKTTNYEIGYKATLFEQRMQIEAALFHINWTNLQLQLGKFVQAINGNINYVSNVGSAQSNGAELTAGLRVTPNLRVNATLNFTNAHLTATPPTSVGVARDGDSLPQSPRWTSSLTADYSVPMGGKTLQLGGAWRYRDAVFCQYQPVPFPGFILAPPGNPTAKLAPWNLFDLYAGLAMKQVSLRLYSTNIFNQRKLVGTHYFYDPTRPMYVPVQPRMIGLSADFQF